MRDRAASSGQSRGPRVASTASFALTVGAVLLGWQIVVQPFVVRAPVEAAIRIAPGSPTVLRRAAEAELAAGRVDNAAELARDALGRSPFDVRALRVVGLTEAQAGRRDVADDILTLAGNWSLRDDPAHAWLVEHRLRSGDYASAFAHADTLARRRVDIHPQIFELLSVAASADPQRVLPVLAQLLVVDPPWRSAYLSSLNGTNEGLQTAARLAILLQSGPKPLTNAELERFYQQSFEKGQIGLLTTVRNRVNRPAADAAVTNGGFDDPTAPAPFQWTLIQKAGAVAQVMADDLDKDNQALRVEYDGYSAADIARQRTFLPAGQYRFRAASRPESGDPAGRMEWVITCATDGTRLASTPAIRATAPGVTSWTVSTVDFSVTTRCPSQLIELQGLALDRRTPMAVWFDRVSIASLNRTQEQ